MQCFPNLFCVVYPSKPFSHTTSSIYVLYPCLYPIMTMLHPFVIIHFSMYLPVVRIPLVGKYCCNGVHSNFLFVCMTDKIHVSALADLESAVGEFEVKGGGHEGIGGFFFSRMSRVIQGVFFWFFVLFVYTVYFDAV